MKKRFKSPKYTSCQFFTAPLFDTELLKNTQPNIYLVILLFGEKKKIVKIEFERVGLNLNHKNIWTPMVKTRYKSRIY